MDEQHGMSGMKSAPNAMMSQTCAKLPGQRVPQLDHVLGKIKEGQRKQLKVLKANLVKKDRN